MRFFFISGFLPIVLTVFVYQQLELRPKSVQEPVGMLFVDVTAILRFRGEARVETNRTEETSVFPKRHLGGILDRVDHDPRLNVGNKIIVQKLQAEKIVVGFDVVGDDFN